MINTKVHAFADKQDSDAHTPDSTPRERGRKFSIVGHRGAMALAPENSIASFQLAAFSGADEIELDVRVTGDGVPLVLHDPTLERLAAQPGPFVHTPVKELSLAQIRTVALVGGQAVPTFAEVLAVTETILQVEIKDPAAVQPLVELLESEPQNITRIKFTSFLPEAMFLLSLHLPAIRRGLIVATMPTTIQQLQELNDNLLTTGASTLHSGFENLTKTHVNSLHAAGIEIHVWPLTCLPDVQRALELDADGGTSDDPGKAREWLSRALPSGSSTGSARHNALVANGVIAFEGWDFFDPSEADG